MRVWDYQPRLALFVFTHNTHAPCKNFEQPLLAYFCEHPFLISTTTPDPQRLQRRHTFSSISPEAHLLLFITNVSFFRGGMPADMSNTLFRSSDSIMSTRRNYGAEVLEDANERLHQEVEARRRQSQARAPQSLDREQVVREELVDVKAKLADATRRREWLETELEAARVTENNLARYKTTIIERIKNIRKLKNEQTEKE